MKHKLSLCLVIAMSLTAFATSPTDDSAAIHGAWSPTAAELGGQPMPDAVLKSISLKLDHGRYEVSVAGELDKGMYTLDPAGKPAGMTVVGTEGPNRGKTFPAIYALDGDTLRVCYDLSGVKRPAEFKSAAGTQLYLVTYRRKKE